MALFMKQDFTPPLLSRKWIAIKFRPNMLLYSRANIVSILESGLLFREDSIEVEQDAPAAEEVWSEAGGGKSGWLTRGERVAAAVGVAVSVLALPPKSLSRATLLKMAVYTSIPLAFRLWHRYRCRGSLAALLEVMKLYLALARRTAACLKEYAALHAQIGSLSSVIESTHTLLCRQQSELCIVMSRASSAVLGNAPWLRDDVAWDELPRDETDNLMKIHHAFLVVQSTLLKHIAMAHYVPSVHARTLYKNHNERIYWIHTAVIQLLTEEFRQNYEALERMYRLLKNSASKDTENVKKLGSAINNNWVYSEIHNGVAKSCLELKLALNKCNSLDVFLDSCALNNQEIDLSILNRDIDNVIDTVTTCLNTIQNSQLRLKKIQKKTVKDSSLEHDEVVVENAAILKIEVEEPQSKDEVFYFIKTEDDKIIETAEDLTTAPGKKEREATKIVLCELRRKLGKREDVMRERERQALAKTMPELKDVPDFPRQIDLDEFVERKGFIKKIKPKNKDKKNHRQNFKRPKQKKLRYSIKISKYNNEKEITGVIYEANAKLNIKSRLLTIPTKNIIIKWSKVQSEKKNEIDSSGRSEGLSDVEASAINKSTNESINNEVKFSKKDLELSLSSSESDFEFLKERELLKDVRRNRVVRKKNVPPKRSIDNIDESLKPIEYTFGTGMAMASVLQGNKVPFTTQEEVFIGDGEVSTDSGNDEDA